MWFKKNKKEETEKKSVAKDDSMSKIVDEVLNEQAAQKEAAIKAAAEKTEPETSAKAAAGNAAAQMHNLEIAKLIEKFHDNQNNDTFKVVFDALLPSVLLVPMAPVPNDGKTDNMQFRPGIITNQDGEKFFPVFSDKFQIPEDYGKKFSMVALPFAACCDLATKIPECQKMLINPFTKQFIINANLAGAVAKTARQQQDKRKTIVEFSTPEPETASLVEDVVKWFETVPEIEKAYFSKMKNQNNVSYVFIIDCPEEKGKELFPQLIEHIKATGTKMPVTLMLYKHLKEAADNSKHINQVYSK